MKYKIQVKDQLNYCYFASIDIYALKAKYNNIKKTKIVLSYLSYFIIKSLIISFHNKKYINFLVQFNFFNLNLKKKRKNYLDLIQINNFLNIKP